MAVFIAPQADRVRLTFWYDSVSPKEFTVTPLGISFEVTADATRPRWVLRAFCHNVGQVFDFALDEILAGPEA